MYTTDGRYFTGEKTYWWACPEPSGHVLDIEASVKAYDNEGRVFKGDKTKLSPEQVKRATASTQGFQQVISEMVREVYEQGCAAEVRAKEVEDGKRYESTPRQNIQDVEAPKVERLGDSMEDWQDPGERV